MTTLSTYLMEAKVPSFKSYAKETFQIISAVKGFSVRKKLSVGHDPKRESASFVIVKRLGDYDDANRDVEQKKLRDASEKMKKTFLQMLYCPSGIVNAKHKVDYEFKHGDEIERQTISFTDTKNGYNVTLVSKLIVERWGMFVEYSFEFYGAETKAQTTFVDFPEFVPGKILHASWGYSMTINTFYEIVKRTNKTVFVVEIGKKNVDGDGWTGHQIPNPDVKEKEVLSGRISSGGWVKIDKKLCRIWDGKPSFYNSLD